MLYEKPTRIGLDWLIKERDTAKYCRVFKKSGAGRCTIPPNIYKRIIKLLNEKIPRKEIAKQFGLHPNTISNIMSRERGGQYLNFKRRELTGPWHARKTFKAKKNPRGGAGISSPHGGVAKSSISTKKGDS